jgi:two-component system OmpR family response regulator
MLRRDPVVVVNPDPERLVRVGELEIDVAAVAVRWAGKRIEMPLREFQVLLLLADNAGRTLSRRSLAELLWGPDFDDVHGNLKIHVARLRRRIKAVGGDDVIRTVRGAGYCLEAAPRRQSRDSPAL